MPQIPRTYTLDACLGRGGFGEVYRARMHRPGGLELTVALKLLRADVDPNGQAAARLRDEARLLSMLDHPAIPTIRDLITLEGRLALVVDWIEGADLGVCAQMEEPLPMRARLQIVASIADALDAAWSTPLRDDAPLRLVHRDVKPANIRVSTRGAPYLLDFGIAVAAGAAREAHTATDLVVGSPSYMPPERFLGEADAPSGDVFSLGAVLHELLAGRRLFEGMGFMPLASLASDPSRFGAAVDTRLSDVPASVDPEVAALLHGMLCHDPTQRPSARMVADLLHDAADAAPGESLPRWARANPWPPAVALASPLAGRTLTEDAGWSSDAHAETSPARHARQTVLEAHAAHPGSRPPTRPEGPRPARIPRRPPAPPARIPGWLPPVLVAASGMAGLLGALQLSPPPRDVAPHSPSSDEASKTPPRDGAAAEPTAPSHSFAPRPTQPAEHPTPRGSEPTTTPSPRTPAPPVRSTAAPTARVEPAATGARSDLSAPAPQPPVATAPTVPVALDPATAGLAPRLLGEGLNIALPAEVPPGEYEVWAEFIPGNPQPGGTATVTRGSSPTLRCANRFCRLMP